MARPNKIRELREAKGWTGMELAQRAGLWAHQIYQYEGGKRTPGYVNLRSIADALGVTTDELFPREEVPA